MRGYIDFAVPRVSFYPFSMLGPFIILYAVYAPFMGTGDNAFPSPQGTARYVW